MPKVAYIPASREELRIDDTLPAKPSKRTSAPAPPVPIDPLMTLMEVGAMLGKTPQAMRMMIYRSEIGAIRIGKRGLRIKRSALDAYIANLPEV